MNTKPLSYCLDLITGHTVLTYSYGPVCFWVKNATNILIRLIIFKLQTYIFLHRQSISVHNFFVVRSENRRSNQVQKATKQKRPNCFWMN